LKSQRRLASEILKTGKNRIWIDPERIEDVEMAITRDDIKRLIHEGAIRAKPKKGVSRSRVRSLRRKKRSGRRGPGSRKGKKTANVTKKDRWMKKVRPLRRKLKELRRRRMITREVYRKLYGMVKGGAFEDIPHLEQYIEANKLGRR